MVIKRQMSIVPKDKVYHFIININEQLVLKIKSIG